MISKPILRFATKNSLGIDAVPKNSLVFIDDYNDTATNRFILVIDNSTMTAVSTIEDFLNNGVFKDIGKDIYDGPIGVQVRQYETISTANQTLFTIADDYVNDYTMVFLNGVLLKRSQWAYLSTNSISLNITTRNNDIIGITAFSDPALPSLSTPTITPLLAEYNMGSDITITVTNWEGIGSTYAISYLTNLTDNGDGTFTGTLPIVQADESADIRIQASKPEFTDSPLLITTITNKFVLYTETFELLVDNTTISDTTFPTRQGIDTTGNVLNGTGLTALNMIGSSVADTFTTTEMLYTGDKITIDGTAVTLTDSDIVRTLTDSTIDTTSITAGAIPSTAYYTEHLINRGTAISSDIVDETNGTIFRKIDDGNVIVHESVYNLKNINDGATVNDVVTTTTPIKNGDNLAIVKDDLTTIVEYDNITGVSDDGLGVYSLTLSPVISEIPSRVFLKDNKIEYKMDDSVGWQEAPKNVETLTYDNVSDTLTNTTSRNLVKDDSGSTTLNTRVTLSNGNKLIEHHGAIFE